MEKKKTLTLGDRKRCWRREGISWPQDLDNVERESMVLRRATVLEEFIGFGSAGTYGDM